MALKKSDLYSSLWACCDELRGGMDASQYKDYVLVLLFVKYVSDKYGNGRLRTADRRSRKGASFKDMVALKGEERHRRPDQQEIIAPLADANDAGGHRLPRLQRRGQARQGQGDGGPADQPGRHLREARLDFSQNRAEGDDILGDAYEYLMRHFATESGKSKGQFYTPAEVSRVIAKVIGIAPQNTKAPPPSTTRPAARARCC